MHHIPGQRYRLKFRAAKRAYGSALPVLVVSVGGHIPKKMEPSDLTYTLEWFEVYYTASSEKVEIKFANDYTGNKIPSW